jgi:hypothetical protein
MYKIWGTKTVFASMADCLDDRVRMHIVDIEQSGRLVIDVQPASTPQPYAVVLIIAEPLTAE